MASGSQNCKELQAPTSSIGVLTERVIFTPNTERAATRHLAASPSASMVDLSNQCEDVVYAKSASSLHRGCSSSGGGSGSSSPRICHTLASPLDLLPPAHSLGPAPMPGQERATDQLASKSL